jgi:hypothetical protein
VGANKRNCRIDLVLAEGISKGIRGNGRKQRTPSWVAPCGRLGERSTCARVRASFSRPSRAAPRFSQFEYPARHCDRERTRDPPISAGCRFEDLGASRFGDSERESAVPSLVPSHNPALQVLISPIRPSMVQLSQRIGVVAFINDPYATQRPTDTLLRTPYELMRAECCLALLLSGGRSPKKKAETIGVTKNTARSQMQSIRNQIGV